MSNRARTNATSESKANSIISTGEIFPDGGMIELVSSSTGVNKPNLLLWNGRKATVGPRVTNSGGRIYEAAELTFSLSLLRAMRLPSHVVLTTDQRAICLSHSLSCLSTI